MTELNETGYFFDNLAHPWPNVLEEHGLKVYDIT